MDSDLKALKERWAATGSFEDEQAYLAARVRREAGRYVFLDPDGTRSGWLVLVVRHETGVIYGTQCAGTATEQRLVEGYLVLLGGSKYDVDDGAIDPDPLNKIFHEGDGCQYSWRGRRLPAERFAKLRTLVEQIPYWFCRLDGHDKKYPLRIDESRIAELAEAWIPVTTPDGPGVLLYKNCD